MVVLPRKQLVLVAFLLLCLIGIAISARARSVPKGSSNGADQKGDGNETFIPKAKGELSDSNGAYQDLVTMDYTPAQNKPPIHN